MRYTRGSPTASTTPGHEPTYMLQSNDIDATAGFGARGCGQTVNFIG
jgi:hypothetical protein